MYDYPSGTQVGTLTGFSEPYGMCINTEGDVFITNFGSGYVDEYAPAAPARSISMTMIRATTS